MNKTAAILAFFALIGLGVIGVIVLLLFAPDNVAVFTTFIVTVLGIGSTAAIVFSALGKQTEQLDTIRRQTNGTLSALTESNFAKDAVIQDLMRRMPAEPPVDGPTGPSTQMI